MPLGFIQVVGDGQDLGGNALGATLTIAGGGIVPGDVNGDGVVDLLDVTPFVAVLAGGDFNEAADINGDGMVDLLDVGPFVDLLSGG